MKIQCEHYKALKCRNNNRLARDLGICFQSAHCSAKPQRYHLLGDFRPNT